MGRTHNKEETFPRLADPLGYVDKADVFDVIKAILATQRDYGDRTQRRHARMKYLIEDWGLDKFRAKVEEYFGQALQPFKPLPDWKYEDYLGWYEQGDGKLFLGISIENGRVKDEGSFHLKKALKKITDEYALPMRLTANHNLIFYEIDPEHKAGINSILLHCGIVSDPEKIDPLTRYSMSRLTHLWISHNRVRTSLTRDFRAHSRDVKSCGFRGRNNRHPHDRLSQRLRPSLHGRIRVCGQCAGNVPSLVRG